MHRVELKVKKDKLYRFRFILFLMHRVELKELISLMAHLLKSLFLMHRVELKKRLELSNDIILFMRHLFGSLLLVLTLGIAFGSDCVAKLGVEEASRQASQEAVLKIQTHRHKKVFILKSNPDVC